MSEPAPQPDVQALIGIYKAMRELLEVIGSERGYLLHQAELIDHEVYVSIDATLAEAIDELGDLKQRLLVALRAIGVARVIGVSIEKRLGAQPPSSSPSTQTPWPTPPKSG